MGIHWTPENVELASSLWQQGWSGSAIGKKLGGTRSAIVGKMHRLGVKTPSLPWHMRTGSLSNRTGGSAEDRARRAEERKLRAQMAAEERAAADAEKARKRAEEEATIEAEYASKTAAEAVMVAHAPFLRDKNPNGCSWPIGERDGEAVFCDTPRTRNCYCAYHYSISRNPTAGPAPTERSLRKHIHTRGTPVW